MPLTIGRKTPSFENTVVALDNSGDLLDKVQGVFHNLNSSLTSPELQKINKELAPEISEHFDAIILNEKLFQRVKTVYDREGWTWPDTTSKPNFLRTPIKHLSAGAPILARRTRSGSAGSTGNFPCSP